MVRLQTVCHATNLRQTSSGFTSADLLTSFLKDVRHKMFRKSSLKSSTLITLRNKIILSPVKVTEQKTQIKVVFQPNHPRRGWLR